MHVRTQRQTQENVNVNFISFYVTGKKKSKNTVIQTVPNRNEEQILFQTLK